jgi:hypothetical protein
MARSKYPPLPLTAAVTARRVADYLARLGFKVGAVSEGDDVEDGSVGLPGGVHVQVGQGYAVVNRWDETRGVMLSWPVRHDADQLPDDIAAATENPSR